MCCRVNPIGDQSIGGVYQNGGVRLDSPVDWGKGTRVVVTPVASPDAAREIDGHVIIVGFGLAGRCVADLLDKASVSYTIIEQNPVTVETQRALGRDIIEGDARNADTLDDAGLSRAALLALTIPDEEAVLEATALARRLNPGIYIVARTNYSSKGMKASQLGADEVIKAEQAVALQFYEKLAHRICQTAKT